MNITLVRHGETKENVAQTIQGQIPGHLTERGKAQAREAAEKLRGRHFDAIYCSDLKRCLDTAEPIRELFPDVPFVTDRLLRERKAGSYVGKPLALLDVHKQLGDWYSFRLPGGGESWEDVRLRQFGLLDKLYAQCPHGSVLIISHRGPVNGIRSILESKTLAQINEEGTPNAGIWDETMEAPVHA